MSLSAHISLLDLSKQLPFQIDEKIKEELCFGENLVVSCGHYEGDIGDDSSESEWTCYETSETDTSEEVKNVEPVLIEDRAPEELPPPKDDEEDDDFHFFFFHDCSKPPPDKTSKDSLVVVDGLPQVNLAVKEQKYCFCDIDKQGKCTCHVKLLCRCGAKTKAECVCEHEKEICICIDGQPQPVCTCGSKVCVCFPDSLPQAICTCDKVDKPCICHLGKFPSPVCTCTTKPTKIKLDGTTESVKKFETSFGEEHGEYYPKSSTSVKSKSGGVKSTKSSVKSNVEIEGVEETPSKTSVKSGKSIAGKSNASTKSVEPSSKSKFQSTKSIKSISNVKSKAHSCLIEEWEDEDICTCQKPDPKPVCLCLKGKKCICNEKSCICGVQRTCICEPTDSEEPICATESSKSICSCIIEKECTCDAKGADDCKCFPKKICTCGDPKNCKCLAICDCADPCICDTSAKKVEECVCLDKKKQIIEGQICTCPCKREKSKKIKRVRAGKHGYRWCHEVDPYHTYFDYGYDMHDKIDYKLEEPEKVKILGLHDEYKDDVCPVHGIKAPPYKKKIRKASLDCCSTVGGISINVETLGEDKDKFLVQVVSHASKEGAKTGSKLVSILDCNLHTLEENRTEHITKKDTTKERRSYMAICEGGYYNKITRLCGERDVVKRIYYSFEEANSFLLEGANVVLLRYLGLLRYKGTIKTNTVLIDGTICESIYVCLGVSQAIVNNKSLFVVKIERHIIEPSGLLHQTLTVLSLRGYIVSHEWADNNYMLHLNPLLQVIPEKDEIEQHAPLRANWRSDLQLLSDYLDRKATRTSEGARYVAENGTLTNIVRDYLQAILLLRPHDALHFTRHYFASALSAMDLPHNEYFDPCPKHVRYYFFEE